MMEPFFFFFFFFFWWWWWLVCVWLGMILGAGNLIHAPPVVVDGQGKGRGRRLVGWPWPSLLVEPITAHTVLLPLAAKQAIALELIRAKCFWISFVFPSSGADA